MYSFGQRGAFKGRFNNILGQNQNCLSPLKLNFTSDQRPPCWMNTTAHGSDFDETSLFTRFWHSILSSILDTGPLVLAYGAAILNYLQLIELWKLNTVKPHLSRPHLSGLFTYPDPTYLDCLLIQTALIWIVHLSGQMFGNQFWLYIKKVTHDHLSGYSINRTVSLGTEVSWNEGPLYLWSRVIFLVVTCICFSNWKQTIYKWMMRKSQS